MSILALRAVLILTGAVVILLGSNVGLGGIQTLGFQGSGDFLDITDTTLFEIRDNHVRFIGGTFLATGLLLVLSGLRLSLARSVVPTIALLFVIGGLARLSAADLGLLTGWDIAPSLLFEVIGPPLLALWTLRVTTSREQGQG